MQLSYRGISSQSNPSIIPTIRGEIIGKYRGVTVKAKYYIKPLSPEASLDLKYRGVSYQGVTHNSINLELGNTLIKADA